MIKVKSFLCVVLFIFSTQVFAKLPYFPIQFPRDEAAHYTNVPYEFKRMTEWWYYNGTLTSMTGKKLGYYLSFNYMYNPDLRTFIPFIEVQVSDVEKQKIYSNMIFVTDKNNYSISPAELNIQYGNVFGNVFSLHKENDIFKLNASLASKQGERIVMSLQLNQKPGFDVLLPNGNGLIDMWEETNSYYYSFTKLITSGYVFIGNEFFQIDPNHSLSWMDHQWGDFKLTPGKSEWIWTCVQLDNGMDINLHQLFESGTHRFIGGSADIVMPNNSRRLINEQGFSYEAEAIAEGQKHPLIYHLAIPEINLKTDSTALLPGQDGNGIWEGVSKVEGFYRGQPITGQAYTENNINYEKHFSK